MQLADFAVGCAGRLLHPDGKFFLLGLKLLAQGRNRSL